MLAFALSTSAMMSLLFMNAAGGGDWASAPDAIVARIVAKVKAGSVVRMGHPPLLRRDPAFFSFAGQPEPSPLLARRNIMPPSSVRPSPPRAWRQHAPPDARRRGRTPAGPASA